MNRNSDTSPKPVHTTFDVMWRDWDRLPRFARRILIEARYDYDPTMALDLLETIKKHSLLAGDGFIETEFARQIRLNDYHIVKQEMEAKWQNLMEPLPPSSSERRSSRTRRTVSTARVSEIVARAVGRIAQNGCATPS